MRCEDAVIRRLELTYFAAAVTSFTYLRFGKQSNREELLDRFTRNILERSIPSSQEQISLGTAISEYQQRHAEYGKLLTLLFDPKRATSGNPATTLLLHVFECVTGTSAQTHMVQIAVASSSVAQFVVDHVDFTKTRV